MKIALDAMGGDHGPAPCIEGALQAAQELNIEVILVGDEKVLSEECHRLGCTDGRLLIRHAPQVVEMHESPVAVARKKRDSSIWIATELVKSGGRVVIISFMSLEDRKVKQSFQAWARGGRATILTKHVVRPSPEEVRNNPPSRSAKLRAAEMR